MKQAERDRPESTREGPSMEQVGTLIWQLRMAAGWSQGRLARQAGVSKTALSRWESHTRRPRVPELEAVLDALGAGPSQRALAFARIECPRAIRHLRSRETTGLGPPPTAGDLLQAMRMRRNLTQGQVAAQLGVGQTAIARWERGERLPSGAQIQALCFALGAREEEMIALTLGRFAEPSQFEPMTWDEEAARLRERVEWHHFERAELDGGSGELEYLVLERKAWLLAVREERARPVLARVYAFHADSMRSRLRWPEVTFLARRALALSPGDHSQSEPAMRAGILAAVAAVYGGNRPAPDRGVSLLQTLLARSPSPEYRAWILSDMAEYLALSGQAREARSMAEHACRVAKYCGYPDELTMRRVDLVRVLLNAGLPAEAVEASPEPLGPVSRTWTNSYPYLRRALTLAEAHQQAGQLPEAAECLESARAVIEIYGHDRLRPRAAALAERMAV